MTTPETDPLDAPTAALAAAILEVSRHVDSAPLTAPRSFALARSSELLASQPGLAALLGDETAEHVATDELHLTPIELDAEAEIPAADPSTSATGSSPTGSSPTGSSDPLAVLEYMIWPDLAAGGALACDLSPEAWRLRDGVGVEDLPAGQTLRVVVGALADGTSWSAVRRPGAEGYVLGAALLPDLTSALVQTLQAQG